MGEKSLQLSSLLIVLHKRLNADASVTSQIFPEC
jgi:hypothetical protein